MKLSELKKMSFKDLDEMWCNAEFAFDRAECGACVTTHGFRIPGIKECKERRSRRHAKFSLEARPVKSSSKINVNIEKIFKLRIKFADLYPDPVPKDALEKGR